MNVDVDVDVDVDMDMATANRAPSQLPWLHLDQTLDLGWPLAGPPGAVSSPETTTCLGTRRLHPPRLSPAQA